MDEPGHIDPLRIYTHFEAADLLHIHEKTVRRLIASGHLPGCRIGRRIIRVTGEALLKFGRGGGAPSYLTPVVPDQVRRRPASRHAGKAKE